jgi:dihydroxyacetone kinase
MVMAVVKKLVNDPASAVDQAIDGLVMTTQTLVRLHGHQVVVRRDVDDVITGGHVAILSGGGSGHEPAMVGYVGSGMLTAAVAGAVFTSPPLTSILAAIREIGRGNKAGVLLIVMNYTGDRLNFGLAQERARLEGIKVQMVVVGEDCALPVTQKTAGRRGLCGTILIHKIAGAMAEQGRSLEEIVTAVEAAASHMGTMSVSLTACSVPGKGPSFTLKADEMELGLGIHGEAGVKRAKVQPADEVVAVMLDHLMSSQSYLSLTAGDQVAVVVNNLGGTSRLEMSIVARAVIQYLGEFHILQWGVPQY